MAPTLRSFLAWSALVLPAVHSEAIFMPQNYFQRTSGGVSSLPVDLSTYFNSRAFGNAPGQTDFDGVGGAYPADSIPPSHFFYAGYNYNFSTFDADGNDNVLASGQNVTVPEGSFLSLAVLGATTKQSQSSFTLTANYDDGTTQDCNVLISGYWTWPYPAGGDIVMPFRYTTDSIDYNKTNIYHVTAALDYTKTLKSVSLPNTAGDANLHIFSMSLMEFSNGTEGAKLAVEYARSTRKWVEGSDKIQIVEAVIDNVGSKPLVAENAVEITVEAAGAHTVQSATVKRLMVGDKTAVEIGIVNNDGVAAGTSGDVTVKICGEGIETTEYTFQGIYGIPEYEATYESIYTHESPNWYNNAKYGIFIHWGPYSVPGWGNSGDKESYAEWYWWDLNQGPSAKSQTFQYHNKTYGPNVVYDDFIANFSASKFDPKAWVDLFADAGANYFVQVSKHHDGFAIFDIPETSSKRSSVAMTLHRNLLKELFDAAEQYQPHLHKATYFSLPEWFHPDYQKYGFGSWPGGNATNPFTNETLPYSGYVSVEDYITDVMVPEMQALADMGTEIMWCDIGGPNDTIAWAAQWFNKAASQNRQVSMNARCGLPGDFDTPEYAKYPSVQARKWESNLGMDSFSFGYNRATPLEDYMTAEELVTDLVDIVSKNGNFLLDIGPKEDGTIIDIENSTLRDAGSWIQSHGEAIFNTTYWYVASEQGELRFTRTEDAFYVLALSKPNSTITIDSNVPWIDGDEVTVVGGSAAGTVVPSGKYDNGTVWLQISDDVAAGDKYVWAFKITY